MANINDMRQKEDYIMAYKEERFSEYVAQQEDNAILWRRVLVVLTMGALICAGAAFALSF